MLDVVMVPLYPLPWLPPGLHVTNCGLSAASSCSSVATVSPLSPCHLDTPPQPAADLCATFRRGLQRKYSGAALPHGRDGEDGETCFFCPIDKFFGHFVPFFAPMSPDFAHCVTCFPNIENPRYGNSHTCHTGDNS